MSRPTARVGRCPNDTVVDAIEVLLGAAPVKLMLRSPAATADHLAVSLARENVGDLVEVMHSSTGDTLLEMSAAGVFSKGSSLGVFLLCDLLGIAANDVLPFGDMPNDLPMLRWGAARSRSPMLTRRCWRPPSRRPRRATRTEPPRRSKSASVELRAAPRRARGCALPPCCCAASRDDKAFWNSSSVSDPCLCRFESRSSSSIEADPWVPAV